MRKAGTAIVAAAAVGALAVSASGAHSGTLRQLAGDKGCIHTGSVPGPCRTGRFLADVASVATSRDGRSLYAVSPSSTDQHGSLAVFARNRRTGNIRQLPGQKGCFSDDMADSQGGFTCADGKGLIGARDVAVSPDDRFVYVVGSGSSTDSIAIFRRNKRTGALTQSSGTNTPPCLTSDGDLECTSITGPLADVHAIAIAGSSAYVASAGAGAVLVFKRNRKNGSLTQRAGDEGCFNGDGVLGCRITRALHEPTDLVVSPNGKQLYVTASEGTTFNEDGAVITFKRARGGKLDQLSGKAGCISKEFASCANGKGLYDANSIAVSRDGRSLYVAGQSPFDDGSDPGGAVAAFARNPSSGKLHQLSGKAGCFTQNGSDGTSLTSGNVCTKGRALYEPSGVGVSPNGTTVYVASGDTPSSVNVFSRNSRSSKLSQLSGEAGCLSQNGSDGANPTCRKAKGIGGAVNLTVSPPKGGSRCQTLYVVGQDDNIDYETGGTIAIFKVRHTGCRAP